MPTDELTLTKPDESVDASPPKTPAAPKFATRDDFLAAAGKYAEEEYDAPGIGLLLLSEIGGDARAEILGNMAMALQPDPETKEKGTLDTKGYQRGLLAAGVVDPNSPPGARTPLFSRGDLDQVMKVGGAVVAGIADVIERLSLMGRYQPSAEGNSANTPNGASTS